MTSLVPVYPNPNLPIDQQCDEVALAIGGWCEAANQIAKVGYVGVDAVQCVILNRVRKRNLSVTQIVTESHVVRGRRVWQFSFWQHDDPRTPICEPLDPNYTRLLRLQTEGKDASLVYQACWILGVARLNGLLTIDPTHGALNYYNPAVCSPKWGRGNSRWREFAVYGDHVFGIAT